MADGRKPVIQCKKYAPHRSVSSQDMQKFVGTARLEHGADDALFVTTGSRSREPRWAWRCARTFWPGTAICWALGSRVLTWRR
ncbi:restriction endonuclease [Streptomyces yangpuensis]|uniref:restriction endonuclease n=1 Tax=Streptomyces yangpuensis TaxID=1648182 RepID=UPI00380E2AAF